jgi:hypothetical protein
VRSLLLACNAYVSRNDRVTGCEAVTYGWPG